MEGMMIIVYIPSSTYDEDDASLHDLNGRDALCLLGSKPNYLGMIKLDQVHACMYSWMDFLLIIYYATSRALLDVRWWKIEFEPLLLSVDLTVKIADYFYQCKSMQSFKEN